MARRITLRQIETFSAMMQAGTVGRTATLLNVSQPAISKLLAHFEEDSGVRLFERERGRLVPTQAARRLYEEIDRIFAGVGQIERLVEVIRREEQGQLSIGVMPALSGSFLGNVLNAFLPMHPGVYLTIVARHSHLIADRIRNRTIDVGLVNADITDADIVSEPFMERDLVCILPPGHPLEAKPVIGPTDLDGIDFIAFTSSNHTSSAVNQSLHALGARPHVVMESSASSAISQLVAAGFGISIVHPIHLHGVGDPVVVRPFRPAIKLHLLMCRRVDRRDSALVKSFVAAAFAEAERSGPPPETVSPPPPQRRSRASGAAPAAGSARESGPR
jgi:DNA-binding transcriptional LysR family regulator